MFFRVYIEYIPCRCPLISRCMLLDDGRDCPQLELALTETNWWLSCPRSENLQPNMALSSWWPTSYLMASLTHGLSLEEEWQLALCMAHLGGEVTWQRWAASDEPTWDEKVSGPLAVLCPPSGLHWSWPMYAHFVKFVAFRPLPSFMTKNNERGQPP